MQTDAYGAAMSFYELPLMSLGFGNIFLCFQLKPVSTTAAPAAATGSLSSVAADPVPHLQAPQ